jgi:hypothetical protein
MELAYEADHVFTNLMSLSDHEMQVPVVVKLGHDCLQVASVGWAGFQHGYQVESFLLIRIVAQARPHPLDQGLYH